MTAFPILYPLLRWVLTGLARLPLCVLYVVSDLLYVLARHVVRYRRRVVRKNLRQAFPDKSPEALRRIEKGFYRHLCDCIVETVKLLHISDAELCARVAVYGADRVERQLDAGRPIIVFLGHYGNWEWVPCITFHYSDKVLSGQIYRPLSSPVADALMQCIRSRFHTVSIPQKRAVRQLLRLRKERATFVMGFIADQRPNSTNLKHWCTFLRQDTAFNPGGEDIGRRLGAAYFYLDVEKPGRGHYRLTFDELTPLPGEEEYPYTIQFLHRMEATINREPALWLWSHDRWKFSRIRF